MSPPTDVAQRHLRPPSESFNLSELIQKIRVKDVNQNSYIKINKLCKMFHIIIIVTTGVHRDICAVPLQCKEERLVFEKLLEPLI